MTHWTSFAGVSIVALSLALPDPSWAQARSRGGSGGGSSSGGSSSGGSHVSRPSGGGGSGGARSAPSQGGGGSRAVARPRSSAPAGEGGGASSSGSQTATVTRSAGGLGSTGNARARDNQPVVGQAQARRAYLPGSPSRPGFGHYPDYPYYSHRPYYPYYGHYPYYPYYPWYGYPWYGGYGFNFGLSIGFGYSPWHHYPYGAYGVPYFYAPYPVYGYAGGSYPDSGSSPDNGSYSADARLDRNDRRPPPTGSIRFRANPSHARVYVDGALVGTVDEFDGLGNHLEIEAGRHQIELRADGYESYSAEVAVQASRTVTERATLKKIN